ncbi:MAG: glucoamylase family protein [bacterium]
MRNFSLSLFLFLSVFFSCCYCQTQTKDRNAKDSLNYFPHNQLAAKPDSSLPDSLLLLKIAKDTWKFFDNSTYGNTGLVVDKIFVDKQNAAHFTSITNIGLYLVCTINAYKLNIITRTLAINKIATTLNTLKKLETYNGFFYNWYEVDILKQSGGYISTVDSGWLYSSLLITSQVFPEEFGTLCKQLIDKANFKWLYDENEGAFRLGYDVKTGFSPYHYKLLCSEARIAFYLSTFKGEINPDNWYKLSRTLSADIDQQQKPQGNYKTYKDINYFNGYYLYDSLKIVPSWGGSSFESLMTDLFVDERIAAKGFGLNNYTYIKAQIDYCLNKAGYNVWGMSPCSTPDGGYSEYGIDIIGTMKGGYTDGVVTPHASIIAVNYNPKEVINNIKTMLKHYDIYGEYGFYDCIDMKTGLTGKTYLALDQAMIFISLSNYLTNNYIPNIFMNIAGMEPILNIIKQEEFYN